jgi:hypothetical protein
MNDINNVDMEIFSSILLGNKLKNLHTLHLHGFLKYQKPDTDINLLF